MYRHGWVSLLSLTALLAFASPAAPADLESVRAIASAGNPRQALAALEGVLQQAPAEPDGLILKGVLLAEVGRTAEAEKVFEDLIRRHPTLPEPYNNLAVIQAASGRYDLAVETLRRSLETHPSYRTAYENLSRIYGQLASEAYSQALEEGESERQGAELVMLGRLSGRQAASATVAPATPVAASAPKPATVAPAPPAPTVAATGSSEAAPPTVPAKAGEGDPISARVEAWARAWSEQRVDDYLSFYSPSFRPANGMTLGEWRELRAERLRRPSRVGVELAFLDAPRLEGGSRASVRFLQSYSSDTFSDVVTKTLELVKEDGVWRILEENVEE